MANLYDLPDELLLVISSNVQGRYRNSDLASLSLVSQRIRPIAQEQLLQEPCFKLTYIYDFLWKIGQHSWIIPKIRSLEIWSTSKGRAPDLPPMHSAVPRRLHSLFRISHYPALACPPHILQSTEFFEKCSGIFSFYAKRWRHQREWEAAFKKDVIQALLGIVLLALPNLKELRLAAAWLMDFPVFSGMRTSETAVSLPQEWRHRYLAGVLEQLQSKLEVLEFPTSLEHMYFIPRPRALFDFRSFSSLKELSLPMEALDYCQYARHNPPAEPDAILPESLELLRITEATEHTANFLNNVCLAVKRSRFPRLRRIELFFYTSHEQIDQLADEDFCPTPVEDVRRMCVDAGLELSLYFPSTTIRTSDARRSLWMLKEEGTLADVELQVQMKNVGWFGWPKPEYLSMDLEWDVDGDAVME